MPRPRRRFRAARYRTAEPTPHDRLAADLPHGAVVAADVVEDPYSRPGQTDRIKVLRSIRDDPLAQLMSRRQIDSAQYQAGRKYEHLIDLSGFGEICAMDPTREPVDGRGAEADRLTDRQIKAAQALRWANAELGTEGARLVHQVLGEGLQFSAIAVTRGVRPSERIASYFGRRFGECLESLARLWGYVS